MSDTPQEQYTIQLFSVLREVLGTSSLTVPSTNLRTTTDMHAYLITQYPLLQNYTFILAVNYEYKQGDVELQPDDELALITPVSGG